MSAKIEMSYFAHRAVQSIRAMTHASDKGARLAHRQLAAAYGLLAVRHHAVDPHPAPLIAAEPGVPREGPAEAEQVWANEGGSTG